MALLWHSPFRCVSLQIIFSSEFYPRVAFVSDTTSDQQKAGKIVGYHLRWNFDEDALNEYQ